MALKLWWYGAVIKHTRVKMHAFAFLVFVFRMLDCVSFNTMLCCPAFATVFSYHIITFQFENIYYLNLVNFYLR